jgi:hypothetical protein
VDVDGDFAGGKCGMSEDPTNSDLSANELADTVSREFVEFIKTNFGQQLDFSVESLRHVDNYLEKIYFRTESQLGFFAKLFAKKFSDNDLWYIISSTGFYTGEVVRKCSLPDHHWFRFKDWISAHPSHIELLGSEPGMGTMFILGNDKGDMCLPLSKSGKFLENGREDSVYYFAQMIASPSDQTE